jgi:hypothetical protein
MQFPPEDGGAKRPIPSNDFGRIKNSRAVESNCFYSISKAQ